MNESVCEREKSDEREVIEKGLRSQTRPRINGQRDRNRKGVRLLLTNLCNYQ